MVRSVTIELDTETEARLRKKASEQGIPLKQYIAELLRRHTLTEWPEDVLQMAGTWKDFPEPEELRASLMHQPSREPLQDVPALQILLSPIAPL
ncbi:MAG: CopG family transcriptional regulator [Armatimonadota bacterium]|nr:CopG family transcriptional regulator [Armatimonadota bacterium]